MNIKPKQSLGQNFLVDDNIARNMVRDLAVGPDDILLEIGPGKGALTSHLAGKGKHLIAMEIDGRVIEDLRKTYDAPDITVIHRDFLESSLAGIRRKYGSKLRLVGNIPYHLTSSILFKAFEEHSALIDVTIMIQREVAERIVARPSTKAYGILSVIANFYGVPEIFFHVSPNCFFPKPKVESSVLRIAFHPKKLFHVDEKLFTLVVKTTFGKRRKTIRNGLRYLPCDEARNSEIANLEGDLMEKRPEQLSVEEFAGLTQQIEHILHRKSL